MASKKKSAGLLFDEVLPQAQRTARSLLSLDPQEDVPASQQALEMALGFVPGVGQAMALRDIERARRANDPAAAAMAAASFVPFGRLAGLGKKAGPVMSELDVYHGSPHQFDEFDASKIGTGEGAQSYGHGIYLAESPRVAKDYQAATSKDRFLTDNGFFDPSELEHLNVRVKARSGDLDSAIEAAKKFGAPDEDYPETAAKAARDLAKLEALKARGGMRPNPGNFYTADLPDEMVDRMLDWDKRISDQPEFVQKAWADWRATPQAQKLVKQMTARGSSAQDIEKMFANPTGETMHKWIYEGYGSAKGGEMPKVASFLKDKGLLGVKYQDAGSRGQGGTGTRNFVVFPGEEKKVKIKKRE